MQPTDNSTACPFCKGSNKCQASGNKTCWCFNTSIPAELIALIPKKNINKSCICNACVNLFNKNPKQFKGKYIQPKN